MANRIICRFSQFRLSSAVDPEDVESFSRAPATGEQTFFATVLLHLIPSMLPVLLSGMLCAIIVVRKYFFVNDDVNIIKVLYVIAFIFGIMHTCQVIVYLFIDTMLYIDMAQTNTSCACTAIDATMSDILEKCTCYVPQMQKHVVFTRTSLSLDGVEALVNMQINEDTSTETEKLFEHLELMVTLLQSSILIAFLRFPMWLTFNSVQLKEDLTRRMQKQANSEKLARQQSAMHLSMLFEDLHEDRCKELVRSASVRSNKDPLESPNGEPFSDVVAVVMRNLRLEQGFEQKRWLIQKQSSSQKWQQRVYAIELCYYCFVEIVDAFSLLDNLSENVLTFAANSALTHATLFFISLSLFVGTAANFLSSHPFRSLPINRYGKSVVVVSNNVPLFILRCIIFYSCDGSHNSLFFLFAIKEFVILILAVVEIIVVFKSPKENCSEES
ncbi:hypothetical protein CAPTEDRAFT_203710 [Capitella teleta]|uniref:Uncharacterized protein n=1 Tax=Capitella teleta TaxID=283909 RepID=R7UR73_CAPTE|nr:hypothetical protein CAPTEDRAFT_203710 [Capitella teleta]|eukprot:ELU09034.1 hypothetical protein CAPTEDRAFT_203710 [Capitella teleta]